jgi:hypothetical protein
MIWNPWKEIRRLKRRIVFIETTIELQEVVYEELEEELRLFKLSVLSKLGPDIDYMSDQNAS